MESSETTKLLKDCETASFKLFSAAQKAVVYRASIAYLLQSVKNFLVEVKKRKAYGEDQINKRALERFVSFAGDFYKIVSKLSDDWMENLINHSSVKIYEIFSYFRRVLAEISQQFGLNPAKVVNFSADQDAFNKIEDLKNYKMLLLESQSKFLNVSNIIDTQQTIAERLNSIELHLPKKNYRRRSTTVIHTRNNESPTPSMDSALAQFKKFNIQTDDISLHETIGSGGFGKVYRATRLSTGEIIAVKQSKSIEISPSTFASLFSEISTMLQVKHKYVIELVGVHIRKPYKIITRYYSGGSLFERIHSPRGNPVTPDELLCIAYQIACGMAYVHSVGIVHRDLKSMNILLDSNGVAHIADFGLSGSLKENGSLSGGFGTIAYAAPEVIAHKHYGTEVDVYSFGVMLWEMATKTIPFKSKTQAEIIEHVVTNGHRLNMNDSIPECMRNLISKCWAENPKERPTFAQIVNLILSGNVYFGEEKSTLTREQMESMKGIPDVDSEYILSVLKDPTNANFPSIAKFISENITPELRTLFRNEGVVKCYTKSSQNPCSILLIAPKLLDEDEYRTFFTNIALPMIQKMKGGEMQYVVNFLIELPTDLYSEITGLIPNLISMMSNNNIGDLILQLFNKMGEQTIIKYKKEIIQYLSLDTMKKVATQKTITAIDSIVLTLRDEMQDYNTLIPLIEGNFELSSELQSLIACNIDKSNATRLVKAFINSTRKSKPTKIMVDMLNKCDEESIIEIAKNTAIYDRLNTLLKNNESIACCLLMLFKATSIPSIPPVLKVHPILDSLLRMETCTAQRLQIFTSLFISKEFFEGTNVIERVFKFIIDNINDDKNSTYAVRLIGAISLHEEGCKMLHDSGMLLLFAHYFLSPSCGDYGTSLEIISNVTKHKIRIPQISLIVSCLMNDLSETSSNKKRILMTITDIDNVFDEYIQAIHLRSYILPLISKSQDPYVILLSLKLLNNAPLDMIKTFYNALAVNVLSVLENTNNQYTDIIAEAVSLIINVSKIYNISKILYDAGFIRFTECALTQISETDKFYNTIKDGLLSIKI